MLSPLRTYPWAGYSLQFFSTCSRISPLNQFFGDKFLKPAQPENLKAYEHVPHRKVQRSQFATRFEETADVNAISFSNLSIIAKFFGSLFPLQLLPSPIRPFVMITTGFVAGHVSYRLPRDTYRIVGKVSLHSVNHKEKKKRKKTPESFVVSANIGSQFVYWTQQSHLVCISFFFYCYLFLVFVPFVSHRLSRYFSIRRKSSNIEKSTRYWFRKQKPVSAHLRE